MMAQGKAKRLSEFLRVFPECVGRCVFVGDNGQGDLDLVRLLDTDSELRFSLSFIHNVFLAKEAGGGSGLSLQLSSPTRSASKRQRRGSPLPGSARAESRTKRWSFSSLTARFLQRDEAEAEQDPPPTTPPRPSTSTMLKTSSASRSSLYQRHGPHADRSRSRRKDLFRSTSLPPPHSRRDSSSSSSSSSSTSSPTKTVDKERFREDECPPTCYMFDTYAEAAARALEGGFLSRDGAQRVGRDAMAEFAAIAFPSPAQAEDYGKLLQKGLAQTM